MAREYTRIKLTIWNDPDFRARSVDAQWLYFVLLTHPSISACGVVDWREGRLAARAANMTKDRLRQAAVELGQTNLIAIDPDTEEALVRSFVRHDGILQSPNMARAMVRQHAEIGSQKLMALVSLEVRRALKENPDWKGLPMAEPVWKQFPDLDGNPFEMVPQTLWERVPETLPERFDNGSETVPQTLPETLNGTLQESFENSSPIPYPLSLTSKEVRTNAHSQANERVNENRFEEFWEAYPRKAGRQKAETKYLAQAKKHGEQKILDGVHRFAHDPNLPTDKNFIPHATTWLERGSWDDEPLPARNTPSNQSQAARNLDEVMSWGEPEPDWLQIEG